MLGPAHTFPLGRLAAAGLSGAIAVGVSNFSLGASSAAPVTAELLGMSLSKWEWKWRWQWEWKWRWKLNCDYLASFIPKHGLAIHKLDLLDLCVTGLSVGAPKYSTGRWGPEVLSCSSHSRRVECHSHA